MFGSDVCAHMQYIRALARGLPREIFAFHAHTLRLRAPERTPRPPSLSRPAYDCLVKGGPWFCILTDNNMNGVGMYLTGRKTFIVHDEQVYILDTCLS